MLGPAKKKMISKMYKSRTGRVESPTLWVKLCQHELCPDERLPLHKPNSVSNVFNLIPPTIVPKLNRTE